VRSITDFLCPDTVSPDSLRPPHCDGIRPRPPLHIHRSGLPAATQVGTCFQPSLLFTLSPALLSLHSPNRTAKYIPPCPFRWDKGEDTQMYASSHICGQSESRTELLRHDTQLTTTNHESRFANSVLHCIIVIASLFPPKGGTNSCSQTLAPCSSYNVRKILVPRKAEPPLTPFGSNPSLPTVRSRRKGPSTEVF
jgi:hypothetical protein